jgi:hypothetical protein
MLGVIKGQKKIVLKPYLQFLLWNQILSHVESMQNQRFPKQIALAIMVGTKTRGKSLTTRRSEAEEDLNTMGLKNNQAKVRD